MKLFKIKCLIASLFDTFGGNKFLFASINKKYNNNYIRIVNYHHSPEEYKEQFIKQIDWFCDHFEICGINDLQMFLDGEKIFGSKPGMIITFDDGYLDNYEVAHRCLKLRNIPAIYMVSAGLVGTKTIRDGVEAEYINVSQLKEMANEGATIGCHTYSHHRMDISDSEEILLHEIVESKKKIESVLDIPINIFCWCGGEERTYTKKASDMVRSAGYKYGFMTNSTPILPGCDFFHLDRSNVEASWALSLIRFQISGLIDFKFKNKRGRVHELTKAEKNAPRLY